MCNAVYAIVLCTVLVVPHRVTTLLKTGSGQAALTTGASHGSFHLFRTTTLHGMAWHNSTWLAYAAYFLTSWHSTPVLISCSECYGIDNKLLVCAIQFQMYMRQI